MMKELGFIPEGMAHLDCDHNRSFCPAWKTDKNDPKLETTVAETQVEAGFISELAAVHCVKTRRRDVTK